MTLDSFSGDITLWVIIGVLALLVLIVIVVILRSIKVAKPDEAIIVTSRQRTPKEREQNHEKENVGQKVVFGSRVFVKPIVEAYFKLSLRSRQLNVQATAQTRDAITIRVNAVAVVKVGGSEPMVRAAAQRFLNQQDQIESSTEEVLSGSVRSIVGQLTVTEIITNRSALQEQVLEAVREALDIQGLQIDTLQIKEIDDDNNYIRDLGRAEAARVKQVAEIAEAQAQQASEEARISAAQKIAESQRALDLRNAEIQKETDKARAEAAAAAPLAEAIAQQEVVSQQEVTAQKRVGLRKQELDAEVRAVADAEAYAVEKRADAAALASVANANAERDARKASAEAIEAEGLAERNRRRSAAEAVEAEGIAELDLSEPGAAELVYFGVTPDLAGQGAAHFMMERLIASAFAHPIDRLWLHTNTIDHPRAMAFYRRAGFTPVRQMLELADDPRLLGLFPRDAAPQVPLFPRPEGD